MTSLIRPRQTMPLTNMVSGMPVAVKDIPAGRAALATSTSVIAGVAEGVGVQAVMALNTPGNIYDVQTALSRTKEFVGPNLRTMLRFSVPATLIAANPVAYPVGAVKGQLGGAKTILEGDAVSNALDDVWDDIKLVDKFSGNTGKLLVAAIVSDLPKTDSGKPYDISFLKALIGTPTTAAITGALTGVSAGAMSLVRGLQISANLMRGVAKEENVGSVAKLTAMAQIAMATGRVIFATGYGATVFGWARGLRDSYKGDFWSALTKATDGIDKFEEVSQLAVDASERYARGQSVEQIRAYVEAQAERRGLSRAEILKGLIG